MAARLVGRTDELARLAAALAGLNSGRGGVVVVAGEAGVGKSRLVAEVASVATQRGITVLSGRAVEGGAMPLRPLAEAFLAAFRDAPPPADPHLEAFRAALSPLVPEWRPLDRAAAAAPTASDALIRNEGILRLLRAVAGGRGPERPGQSGGRGPERPGQGAGPGCLLVIEDLHWADAETLTVVEHLAGHTRGEPVLCVCTVRSESPSPGLALVRAAAARGSVDLIHLARLSGAEMVELARAASGDAVDPAQERAVCDRAEGLPLLAEDLLVTARTTGAPLTEVVPLTFAGTVRERLGALGAEAVETVRAAAVLGREFDWHLLAAVTGLDDAQTGAALRTAAGVGLVVASPEGGFAFRHALTRDAVLADLLPMDRERLAGRALAAIEQRHPALPGEWCEVAARLAKDAGNPRRAGALLLEVARRAAAEGALTAAEAAIERSRALAEDTEDAIRARDDVHLDVLVMAGKTDQALELGTAMLVRQRGDDAAATHLRLARTAAAGTRWEVARRHLRDVRRLAGTGAEVVVHANALEATIALSEGHPDQAVALAEQALAAGHRLHIAAVVCEALEVLGRAARPRDLLQAEARFATEAQTAREAGLRLWEIRALHELGTVDMLGAKSLDRLEQARALAADSGAVGIAAVVDLQLASAYALRFEPELAIARAGRGRAIADVVDLGLTGAMLLAQTASAHAVAGHRAEMEAAIAAAANRGDDHPEVWVVGWGHARAFLALLQDDRTSAVSAFREAHAWAQRPECGIPGIIGGWLALLTTVDGPEGDVVRAEVREQPGMVVPLNRVLVGYADAVALGRQGRSAAAEQRAAAMDGLVEQCLRFDGWRHLARRHVAEAALADGWGDPVRWLREALPWFEGHGYSAVARAGRQLLAQAGAPVPRRGRGVTVVPPPLMAQGVTSREADVLGLLAAGLSNQEIADRLYLSPRTVEKHVERLRDKTAAPSRAALEELATKYGLAAP